MMQDEGLEVKLWRQIDGFIVVRRCRAVRLRSRSSQTSQMKRRHK
jgi:hypothetical protein